MKSLRPFLVIAVLACSVSAWAKSANVSGRVFLDSNRNGILDKDERGLSGIYVSDGERIVKTKKKGNYTFDDITIENPVCVFAIKPEGLKFTKDFFIFIDDDKENANIGLSEDPESKNKKFSFIHSSDIQFLIAKSNREWVERFKKLEEISKAKNSSFYICVGDLTPHGKLENLMAIRKETDKSARQFWPCFGGHDALEKEMKHPRTGNYQKVFGPLAYSWNYGGVHFIATISEKSFLSPFERERIWKWLLSDLKYVPANKPVILIGHITKMLRKEIAELKKDHKIIALLQGHMHAHHVYNMPEEPVICSAPWRTIDWGAGTIRARVVNIDNGKISTETIPIIKKNPSPSVDKNAQLVKILKNENWNSHTGSNKTRSVQIAMKPPLKLRWKMNLGKFQPYSGSPVLYKGKVYFGTSDPDIPVKNSGVVCIDAVTGKILWKKRLPESIYSSILASDNKIFALGAEGTLWALDFKNGEPLWSAYLYQNTHYSKKKTNKYEWRLAIAPLAFDSGKTLATMSHQNVAVDSGTGKILWRQRIASEVFYPMGGCASSSHNVFAESNKEVAALNLDDGKVVWKKNITELGAKRKKDRGLACPLYSDGSIYFAHRSNISKIEASTGKLIWNFPVKDSGMNYLSSFALSGNKLVFASGSSVSCLNASNGKMLWNFKTRNRKEADLGEFIYLNNNSSPAIIGKTVCVGADDGYFYVLSLNDGSALQEIRIGSPVKSSPACAGNLVCFSDFAGNLYGYTFKQ